MIIGSIRTIPQYENADKIEAVKVLEEATEVYQEWKILYSFKKRNMKLNPEYLEDECADLIMALSNMLAGFGVTDLTEAIKRCEQRNEKRGRYGTSESSEQLVDRQA